MNLESLVQGVFSGVLCAMTSNMMHHFVELSSRVFSGGHKKARKITFEALKATFLNKLCHLEANGGHKTNVAICSNSHLQMFK